MKQTYLFNPKQQEPQQKRITTKTATGKKTSGLAIASLSLGVISIIPAIEFLFGIIAIILGYVSLTDIKKDSSLKGEGFAITGIILGFLGLILSLIIFLAF